MGLFYCFGCGASGNIISFIMRYNKCSYKSAANKLMEYSGCNIESVNHIEAIQVLKKYKKRQGKTKQPTYKILDDNIMCKYQYDTDKLADWVKEGMCIDVLEKYKVGYDPLSDRIVFPIRNMQGQIINISGRTLNANYKALKIRKYSYFYPLGVLDTLYAGFENIQSIKEKGKVILFEGAKSVFLAESYGFNNVASILTSHLNPQQLKILIKLGVTVVFALDKGIDIRHDKNIQKLARFVKVEYIYDKNNLLDEKMSPVDEGRESFEVLYERRKMFN